MSGSKNEQKVGSGADKIVASLHRLAERFERPGRLSTVMEHMERLGVVCATVLALFALCTSERSYDQQVKEATLQHDVANRDLVFKYLETLYERTSCDSSKPLETACGLDDESDPDCSRQCLPSHDLRLRMAAAEALLKISEVRAVREVGILSLYGVDAALPHVRLPYFEPAGSFGRVLFHGADLRCSDFSNAHFQAVSVTHADLRGSKGWRTTQVDAVTDWNAALCPDGQHWVDGVHNKDCRAWMKAASRTSILCAVKNRSVPRRNAEGTLSLVTTGDGASQRE